MDIVGGVGAIVGIIDVVTRIVLVLRDVKSRLEEADTTLMALIGELTTIKAALNQVKALIESRANEEMHHQLVMDLDDTLGCCLTLVNVVDDRVMQLNWHDGANLRPVFRAKVKLVLNSQDMTGSLQSLSRILTAVNTLILAYNRCEAKVYSHIPY